MYNRELKAFHNENRTRVTKKEFSGAKIAVGRTPMGKNLFDLDLFVTRSMGMLGTGYIFKNSDGNLEMKPDGSGSYYNFLDMKLPADRAYTISYDSAPNGRVGLVLVREYDENGNNICNTSSGVYNAYYKAYYRSFSNKAYTIPAASKAKYFMIGLSASGGADKNIIIEDIMLNEGATVEPYEPFIRETYPVNAPMDLKIFGNSEQLAKYIQVEGGSTQKVTEQGKNLLDITKYKVQYNPEFTLEDGVLDFTSYTWTHYLYYEIKGLTPSAKYTFSLVSDRQAQLDYDDKTHTNEWLAATTKNADGTYSAVQTMTAKADGSLIIRFRYGLDDPVFYCKAWDIMLEPGSSKTTFEPFVPSSPSTKYPSEITPTVAAGTYKVVLSDGVYELTIPDLYGGVAGYTDKVIIDEISKTARLKKEIDESLLDFTKTIGENTQAILLTPSYADITLTKVSNSTVYTSTTPYLPLTAYGKNLTTARAVYGPAYKFKDTLYEELIEDGRECIRFTDNNTIPFQGIAFKEKTQYTVSFDTKTVIKSNDNAMNSWAFAFTYTDGTYTPITINRNADWTHKKATSSAGKTVAYIGLKSQTWVNWVYIDINTFQFEEGKAATELEPFNATPPESLSPSKDFPHYIYSAREMRIKSVGAKTVSTKMQIIGNAMEVTDFTKSNLVLGGRFFVADYIEYISATNKAYRYKFIDDTLLDNTAELKDQLQAILKEPMVEELTPGSDRYVFKDIKSDQYGFVVSTESYSTDGLPNPAISQIDIEVKVVKGAGNTYNTLNNYTYDELSDYTYDELSSNL